MQKVWGRQKKSDKSLRTRACAVLQSSNYYAKLFKDYLECSVGIVEHGDKFTSTLASVTSIDFADFDASVTLQLKENVEAYHLFVRSLPPASLSPLEHALTCAIEKHWHALEAVIGAVVAKKGGYCFH